MDLGLITRVACLFVLVAAGETLNGIVRTLYPNRRVGVQTAKRLSLVPALLLCLAICYLYVPSIGVRTDGGLLLLGVSLSLFMLAFDALLTVCVMRARLATMWDELNILKGNLLGVGVVVMALCPFLSSKIPRPW